MGRKHEGGGTAGGGRSGSKGRLVYNRVIPNFLQRLAGPDYTANPVDAKRHGMNTELEFTRHEDDAREKLRGIRERRQAWKEDVEGEVRRLEDDGFNVVQEIREVGEGSARRGESWGKESGEVVVGKGESGRDEGRKRLRVSGRIEKKRVATGHVANAFGVKNRQKLSFAESDSDSESD